MRKSLFWLLTLSLLPLWLHAQQNISFGGGHELLSPEVHPDGTVTFRLSAPQAQEVAVIGDWEVGNGYAVMQKDSTGLWSTTLPALPSEMYMYRFLVDKVAIADPLNAFMRRDVGTLFSIFYVGGGYGDLYQVQDVPHGSLSQVWYPSAAAGMERRLSVYTPAGYGESKRRYPVLYLLHGSGGDENAWVELGHVVRIMDNLIAAGEIEPMMVVMPNGNFSMPAAPGETKENMQFRPVMSDRIPGNYKNGHYEMAFDEIVNYIDHHYRTKADKAHRSLAGLSMGGFHTLFIALNHPGMFDHIALFSAGLGKHFLNEEVSAYQDVDGKLLRLKREGYAHLWIAIGKDDFLYDVNQDFRRDLERLGLPYTYHESTRGHMWCNWRQYLVMWLKMVES